MTTPVGGGVPGLPRAGLGGPAESTSANFLLIGSLLALLYVAALSIIRRVSHTSPEMEDDGIIGL
ncbi:MAG: hypothetical protein U0531_03850 [Dehalococcoidia bacterium]